MEDYIGLHVAFSSDNSVLLSQPHRIEMLVRDYNLEHVKCPSVPMSTEFNDNYQNDSIL